MRPTNELAPMRIHQLRSQGGAGLRRNAAVFEKQLIKMLKGEEGGMGLALLAL